MKKVLLVVLGVILALVALVGGYVGYVQYTFARAEAEVDLAVPVPASPEAVPGEIVIQVRKDGTLMVNTAVLTLEQLRERLQRIAGIYPNQQVVLRGEPDVGFPKIMEVLDICQTAGIWNVAFAEDPKGG